MNEKKSKVVYNLIIVDESGSMSIIHEQAFTGMNETLQTIRKMQEMYPDQEQRVTLITFDTNHTSWHYDNALASQTNDIKWGDYNPGGCTPLYDAIGNGVSKVNSQINEGDHVLVTIITDGEENSSVEWTLKMVHNLIEKLKKQNWTFTLIGTDNLDVETMANSFNIDNHMKFKEDAEGTINMFKKERRSRENFMFRLSKNIETLAGKFFEDD